MTSNSDLNSCHTSRRGERLGPPRLGRHARTAGDHPLAGRRRRRRAGHPGPAATKCGGLVLAGLGGSLAWWALTGEGDFSDARRWLATLDTRVRAGRARPRRTTRPPIRSRPATRRRGHRRSAPALGVRPRSRPHDLLRALRRFRSRLDGACLTQDRTARSWPTTVSASPRSWPTTSSSRSFPALLFLVAIDQLHAGRAACSTRSRQRSRASRRAKCSSIVQDQILKIAHDKNGGLLTLGMLGTIWSTSSGVNAIIDTLNQAYDIQEGRPWWKVKADRDRPDARLGALHRRLVRAGAGRTDARRESRGLAAPGPGVRVDLEDPAVAGRVRARHARPSR